MITFSGRNPSQHPWELTQFIRLLQREGVTRYLEIGARHGDTFHMVMAALPAGSVGVAVDLPGGVWGQAGTDSALRKAAQQLRQMDRRVQTLLGDSTTLAMVESVAAFGPFDAVLIDGDHRYAGVKADWENYGRMARIVAFHDIAGDGVLQKTSGHPVEVPLLWRELAPRHVHTEFVAPNSTMGIGVIWT